LIHHCHAEEARSQLRKKKTKKEKRKPSSISKKKREKKMKGSRPIGSTTTHTTAERQKKKKKNTPCPPRRRKGKESIRGCREAQPQLDERAPLGPRRKQKKSERKTTKRNWEASSKRVVRKKGGHVRDFYPTADVSWTLNRPGTSKLAFGTRRKCQRLGGPKDYDGGGRGCPEWKRDARKKGIKSTLYRKPGS